MSLDEMIDRTLRGSVWVMPDGFEGFKTNGSTKSGASEQSLAAMERAALIRDIPGVVFDEITVHQEKSGRLVKVEVDYMDEVHDPSSRTVVVHFT